MRQSSAPPVGDAARTVGAEARKTACGEGCSEASGKQDGAARRGAGRFITFEGIDGAGKTTHLGWFAERLRARAQAFSAAVITTREPGGTPLGERLREIVLHEPMHLETEALLMFAARREHLAVVIEPALARGDWVLSDRFTDASFAYQGGGRGLARDKLEALEHWVQDGLQPDLTVLFDLPPQTAQARRRQAREADRFESESEAFFTRTRTEYLRRAAAAPQRYAVIDSSASPEAIRARLAELIGRL